jgi:L-arabinose isomerase
LIDVGNRFRIIVNEVEGVRPLSDLPKLPVARAFWEPKPNLSTAASCWILAGGAHHTAYSQAITTEYIEDFAEILGIELVTIDDKSTIGSFKEKLKLNEVYYHIFNNKL